MNNNNNVLVLLSFIVLCFPFVSCTVEKNTSFSISSSATSPSTSIKSPSKTVTQESACFSSNASSVFVSNFLILKKGTKDQNALEYPYLGYISKIKSNKRGEIYILSKNDILKISNMTVMKIVGSDTSVDGHITKAKAKNPSDISVSESGDVFFIEPDIFSIRKIKDNDLVETIVNMQKKSDPLLFSITSTPELFFTYNKRYYKLEKIENNVVKNISVLKEFNTRGNGSTISDMFWSSEDGLYFLDYYRDAIYIITLDEKLKLYAANPFSPKTQNPIHRMFIENPISMTMDEAKNMYILSRSGLIYRLGNNGEIRHLAGAIDGKDVSKEGTLKASEAKFQAPSSLAIDRACNLYVADGTSVKLVSSVLAPKRF